MRRIVTIAAAAICLSSCRKETEVTWHPSAVAWGHMPISVHWDHAAFADYNQAIETSFATWNNAVGCPVLAVASDTAVDFDVAIRNSDDAGCGGYAVVDRNAEKHVFGTTTWCLNYALVQFPRLDDAHEFLLGMIHEDGHVIGLADDEGGPGAMSPQIFEPGYPIALLPNKADVEAIRSRYCH